MSKLKWRMMMAWGFVCWCAFLALPVFWSRHEDMPAQFSTWLYGEAALYGYSQGYESDRERMTHTAPKGHEHV